MLIYNTPVWDGFDAAIAYHAGTENTAPGLNGKDKAWGFTPRYINGPIKAFYSYFKSSNTQGSATVNAALPGDNMIGNRLGASYKFPMGLTVGLIWDKNKIETADGTAGLAGLGVAATGGNVAAHARRERTAWSLPIRYDSGPHTVYFTYATAGNVKTDVGTVSDSGAKLYSLAYEYALSKRTSVAATYVMINNGANAGYDSRDNAGSIASTSGTGLSAGVDPRVFQLALRHAF